VKFVATTCIASSVQHGTVSGGKSGRQSELTFQPFACASKVNSASRQ